MEFRFDAYCGLFCGSCEMLHANKNNKLKELNKERNQLIEDIRCFGCKSDTVAKHCRTCEIKLCNQEKNIEFCYQCSEYPCIHLTKFKETPVYPYHCEVFDNLKSIEENGLNQWLEEQRERWSCPQCNKAHCFFQAPVPMCTSRQRFFPGHPVAQPRNVHCYSGPY